MRVTVKKWGSSAAVRIPASVMKAAKLRVDAAVDIREEAGRIVIEPPRGKMLDLHTLLAGITPENLHSKADFGPIAGNEAL